LLLRTVSANISIIIITRSSSSGRRRKEIGRGQLLVGVSAAAA
jgi:hypothetical protein